MQLHHGVPGLRPDAQSDVRARLAASEAFSQQLAQQLAATQQQFAMQQQQLRALQNVARNVLVAPPKRGPGRPPKRMKVNMADYISHIYAASDHIPMVSGEFKI